MTYAEKLKDPRWQRVRLQVMERDQWMCRDCYDTKKTLTVHHCHYERGGPWETPLGLLLTLCEECHESRQKIEDNAKRSVGEIFSRCDVLDLREFSASLIAADKEDLYSPKVYPSMDIELGKYRWKECAICYPMIRSLYERITGDHPDWERETADRVEKIKEDARLAKEAEETPF